MTPRDTFVARANIERMRQQIAVERDPAAMATLEQLLEAQIATLRAGEAGENQRSRGPSEEP